MEAFIIQIEVRHPCINIEALDKVKDKDARILMKGITHAEDKGISHIFEVESKKSKELIEAHKTHPLTKKVDVISKDDEKALFILTSKPDIGVAHALAKTNCIILGPVLTEDECDKLTIFAPSWNSFRNFIDSLPEDFEVTIKSKRSMDEKLSLEADAFKVLGFMELKSLSEMLTSKQVEILNIAIAKGYYSKPRKITLNELAEHLDISPATLHEHLNKIESRIMPVISKIMRLFG